MNKIESILIVNDEETVRRSLSDTLVQSGYECCEAKDPYEAYATLSKGAFELVILDMNMLDNSAYELLSKIKRERPETAIIIGDTAKDGNIMIENIQDGDEGGASNGMNSEDIVMSVERILVTKKIEHEVRKYEQSITQTVAEQHREINRLHLASIEVLVNALEAKDRYTSGHSRRVAEIAATIGRELGLTRAELGELRWGSLLHDIGKIGVDPKIQNKPAKLSPEEYEQIMAHVQIGTQIVSPIATDKMIVIIGHHHDHFDGKGFQQQASGEDVPLEDRILTVADSFDAMITTRPYREALPVQTALKEIQDYTGSQFDPVVTKAFLKIPVPELMSIRVNVGMPDWRYTSKYVG